MAPEAKVGDIVSVPSWAPPGSTCLAVVVPSASCGAACEGPWVSVRFVDNDMNGRWESTEYPVAKIEVVSRA
jgi:hypothetical protein